MILPERVFGRPGAKWSLSGVAIGPMTVRTWPIRVFLRTSVASTPCFSVT